MIKGLLKKRLKERRKAAGLTQQQLANRMGVHLKTEQNWEQGIVSPTLETLLQLCDVLDCDMDYLIGRIDQRTHEIQDIHDLTGLSPIAVEKLIKNTQEKEKRLEEYRKNDEPLNDWYYQNGVTSTQIREYLINTLLTDDELWGALIRNACAAVDEMDRYLSQESGHLLLPPGVDNAAGYMIPDFQHIDNINARRYAAGTAFSAFWDRLCTSAPFIEQGYVVEDNAPEEEHEYNNIIAYGLEKKILHE